MNSYDETPWWCQLLWPWFGPPWYAEIEDPDAFWAAIARQADDLADDLAGDDRPGGGYLAKAGRLTAAASRPKRSSGTSTGRSHQIVMATARMRMRRADSVNGR
ncbi:MAG: hypothetical protein ACRDPY_15660 [Streptosporangiaceae bacterium]